MGEGGGITFGDTFAAISRRKIGEKRGWIEPGSASNSTVIRDTRITVRARVRMCIFRI